MELFLLLIPSKEWVCTFADMAIPTNILCLLVYNINLYFCYLYFNVSGRICVRIHYTTIPTKERLRPNTKSYWLENLHVGFYYPYAGWYWKWAISVHSIWYLPYKSNRWTGALSTWNVRITPNLIFRLVYLNNTNKNYRHRSTGSGTSHISQIGKPVSSVHRVRCVPYKSNRYTGVLTTWNIRFTPNLIFKIIC